jgi:hypothetical protein
LGLSGECDGREREREENGYQAHDALFLIFWPS